MSGRTVPRPSARSGHALAEVALSCDLFRSILDTRGDVGVAERAMR